MKKTALFLVLLIAACQQPVTYAPKISQEELKWEETTQQQMVDEAAQYGGMPRPWRGRPGISKQFEQVADRIDKAGVELCQEMGLPKQGRRCYYYFELSRDRDLNAHADGKTIVMNNGMMRFLQNDNEVAIILSHELAHNMMAHVDAKRDNALMGLLVGALLDGAAATQGIRTGGDSMQAGAEAGALTYSVAFEEEADYVGLYIAARAGYDIRQAPNIWRRLTLEEPRMLFNGYDHPSPARRVLSMQKAIAEIENKRVRQLALVPELKGKIQEASPAAGK